jgi:tRNA 2-thiocytidine biosynthesis protein TtcA
MFFNTDFCDASDFKHYSLDFGRIVKYTFSVGKNSFTSNKDKPDNWGRVYPRAIRAEKDFGQLEKNDRILVGLSGGSDSLVLLDILAHQQKKLGRNLGLSLTAGHIRGVFGGKPITPLKKLREICTNLDIQFVLSPDHLPGEIFGDCFKCSLVRRKMLFDMAERCGCNKIALGHNADDLVETALLNMMYSGKLASILPKQPVLKGKMHIIRPLAYVWKEEIVKYSQQRFGKVKTFSCPGAKDSKRLVIRKLLKSLQSDGSPVKENVLKSLSNPKMEYLPITGPK